MSNIINFTEYTKNDIDPNKVLEGAKDALTEVLVLGNREDGSYYCAASTSDIGKLIHAVELFKFKLMRGDFN